jgi:hypothetical protein
MRASSAGVHGEGSVTGGVDPFIHAGAGPSARAVPATRGAAAASQSISQAGTGAGGTALSHA